MPSSKIILYMLIAVGVLLGFIVVAYMVLRKKLQQSDVMQMQKLRAGTQEKTFSLEILYQKLYTKYIKTPFLKRYLFKIRRRLEIINVDDEYLTRKQTSQILTKALLIIIPLTLFIILIAKSNALLLSILLIFELFIIDTLVDGMVDKMDNRLLQQQIDFFAEIRHAYHEYNMVEEAIYQVAQDDENVEMARQAEKIYEILISNDPESELEKYYDVAPNSYLKEFAGISYLTKEFGDRKVDKTSLYLKNLNNISQEMQLEILKRDKLDYVFQSLSVISILPLLALEPIKNWAVSQFSFTSSFYLGKQGMIVQILIVILTFLCYTLTRKLKDNGSTIIDTRPTNPWQEKIYKLPVIKQLVDCFIPKDGTKERRRLTNLIKDSATKDKIQWIYVSRISLTIIAFVGSLLVFTQLHRIEIDYIYTQPTSTYNIVGEMSDKNLKSAQQLTESDNKFLNKFRGKTATTLEDIEKAMSRSEDYATSTDDEIEVAAKRVLEKLRKINSEYLSWFEMLLAMVFALVGYNLPIWLLYFQVRMRKLEMEDEVMQFQTIILMLMRIERVNVEMILEWLERYSNIFKEPLAKCINNYESGSWEALEQLKDDVNYKDFIRIVESLQAAVEKIPIADAFDELDSEREYYQAKRKESNERLISKKGMIGKVIGFAPMVCLFVGYLIIPLVLIGLTSMNSSFAGMSSSM
ncbi:MAG: hypothetical protein ACLU33_01660 [Christensenellales bacterium]